MKKEIAYPEVDEVIEFNQFVLSIVRATKADSHGVLSIAKITSSIEECKKTEGDIYLKAAVLMKSLTGAHAFASGNRRTAFIAAKDFLTRNGGKMAIPDDPQYAQVLKAIREGKYSDEEIGEWIKNGRIKQAER